MSKMGISTVASYRCAHSYFEAVGLHDNVVKRCFDGVDNRINGADFSDFEQDLFNLSKRAWLTRYPSRRWWVIKNIPIKENITPIILMWFQALQKAVNSGDYADYQRHYSQLVQQRPITTFT